jgi:hypothetical protein
MKARVQTKVVWRLAVEAGMNLDDWDNRYEGFNLHQYTKLYHEYQVKRMKKLVRDTIREALEEALKHHNVEVIR